MLTYLQAQAFLAVLLAFGVSPTTANNVYAMIYHEATTTAPTIQVIQTPIVQNQPVYFGSTQPTAPVVDNTLTQTAPVVQSPVMTLTITVVPWLINPDNTVTKNPTSIPVSVLGKTYTLVYTVDVAPTGNWLIEINYPTKEQGNPQGTVKMGANPSKDVNDFAYRAPGAFYADKPGTYTTTFVATNGTDTATTTTTITAQ